MFAREQKSLMSWDCPDAYGSGTTTWKERKVRKVSRERSNVEGVYLSG